MPHPLEDHQYRLLSSLLDSPTVKKAFAEHALNSKTASDAFSALWKSSNGNLRTIVYICERCLEQGTVFESLNELIAALDELKKGRAFRSSLSPKHQSRNSIPDLTAALSSTSSSASSSMSSTSPKNNSPPSPTAGNAAAITTSTATGGYSTSIRKRLSTNLLEKLPSMESFPKGNLHSLRLGPLEMPSPTRSSLTLVPISPVHNGTQPTSPLRVNTTCYTKNNQPASPTLNSLTSSNINVTPLMANRGLLEINTIFAKSPKSSHNSSNVLPSLVRSRSRHLSYTSFDMSPPIQESDSKQSVDYMDDSSNSNSPEVEVQVPSDTANIPAVYPTRRRSSSAVTASTISVPPTKGAHQRTKSRFLANELPSSSSFPGISSIVEETHKRPGVAFGSSCSSMDIQANRDLSSSVDHFHVEHYTPNRNGQMTVHTSEEMYFFLRSPTTSIVPREVMSQLKIMEFDQLLQPIFALLPPMNILAILLQFQQRNFHFDTRDELLNHLRIYASRRLLLSYLTFPKCKLFSENSTPIVVHNADLDRILQCHDNVHALCQGIEELDFAGNRYTTVDELILSITDLIQKKEVM